MNITPKNLLDAGVHFGHQLKRWNPKSKPFVYANRNGISIIDLEKTHELLQNAYDFIVDLVSSGKDIWFIGTKKQAQKIIKDAAISCKMPYCANRWMGGGLTNFSTIKTSLTKYRKFLNLDSTGELAKLPSKEEAAIRRQMSRMHRNFEGIIDVENLPAAIFIVDINNEDIAVLEANKLKIPIIGLVDTNSDPNLIDYPIPGNDDAVKSIGIIVDAIKDAVEVGLSQRKTESSSKSKVIKKVTPDMEFKQDEEVEVTLPEGYEQDVENLDN